MWPIMRRWAFNLGLLGLALAVVLTACVLKTDNPRRFWELVTISDYLFPAHRLILIAPDAPRIALLITYLVGFIANAGLYAAVGIGAGGLQYALGRLRNAG